jgi:AAA+ superfamily predicted ATPase
MNDWDINEKINRIKFKINSFPKINKILYNYLFLSVFIYVISKTLNWLIFRWTDILLNYQIIFFFFLTITFILWEMFSYLIDKISRQSIDLNRLLSMTKSGYIDIFENNYPIKKFNRIKFIFSKNASLIKLYGEFKFIKNKNDKSLSEFRFISYIPKEYLEKVIENIRLNNDVKSERLVFTFKRSFTNFKYLIILITISIFIANKLGTKMPIDDLINKTVQSFTKEEIPYKLINPRKEDNSFDKIIGNYETKNHIKSVIKCLKNDYLDKNSSPAGIVLYGPPGTGKTMLASSFAAEMEAPFIKVSGEDLSSNLLSKSVGGTEQTLRKLYKKANSIAKKNNGYVILYIDEMEKMGEDGFNLMNIGGKGGKELLSILDGPEGRIFPNVFLIATVNDKKWFDKSVLRSRRLSLTYHMDYPKYKELLLLFKSKIEELYDQKKWTKKNIDKTINEISKDLTKDKIEGGLSGADIDEAVKGSFYINAIDLELDVLNEEILIKKTSEIIIIGIKKILKNKRDLENYRYEL